MNTSVSRIGDASNCLRYWWLTAIQKQPTPESAYATFGIAVAKELEAVMKGDKSGTDNPAAQKVLQCYPLPGQAGVQVEQRMRAEWAGATLWGAADLVADPTLREWGRGMSDATPFWRILDVKTIGSLRFAKTKEELKVNRQLLAYVRGILPNEPYVEVGHITVERNAPYLCAPTLVLVSQEDVRHAESLDVDIIRRMSDHRKAERDSDVPAAPKHQCQNWYGKQCPFFDRCHSSVSVAPRTALAQAFAQVGVERGSGNMTGVIDMVNPPDATPQPNTLKEGVCHSRTAMSKSMKAFFYRGERHGTTWELRISSVNGGLGKFLLGGTPVKDKTGEIQIEGGTPDLGMVRHLEHKDSQTFILPAGFWPEGEKAFPDIEAVRAQILYPILDAWDLKMTPVAEEQPVSTETEDALAALDLVLAESVPVQHGNTDAAEQIQDLVACGCTRAQAEAMQAAGYTKARLIAGQVSVEDLMALKGFGDARARKVWGLFQSSTPEAVQDVKASAKTEAIGGQVFFEASPELKSKSAPAGEVAVQKSAPEPETPVSEEKYSITPSGHVTVTIPKEYVQGMQFKLPKADPQEPSGYVIYVGCVDLGSATPALEQILEPYMARAAARAELEHFHLLKRFEQQAALVKELLADPPKHPKILVADPTSALWSDVRVWFCQRSSQVIQRL